MPFVPDTFDFSEEGGDRPALLYLLFQGGRPGRAGDEIPAVHEAVQAAVLEPLADAVDGHTVAGVVAQEDVMARGRVVHRRHTTLSAATCGPCRDSARPSPVIPAAGVQSPRAVQRLDVLRYIDVAVGVDAILHFIFPFSTILSASRWLLYGTVYSPVKSTVPWATPWLFYTSRGLILVNFCDAARMSAAGIGAGRGDGSKE